MYNVTLISLHDTGTYGHRCMSSILKDNNFNVSNIFFLCNRSYQDAQPVSNKELRSLCDLMNSLKPDLIGINVHSSFGHGLAETIISKLKSNSDVPVIMGGIHPTVLPKYCLENTKTDFICVGEGEESVVELCQNLEASRNINIPGIVSRSTEEFENRVPSKNLNELPFQDVSESNMFSIQTDGGILEGDPLLSSSYYYTKASRGCPFHCSFCSTAQLRDLTGSCNYYRLRSVDNVIEELKRYLNLNKSCTYIKFWDDTFPYKKRWNQEFAEKYKNNINLPFEIWLNPNTTREVNISKLKQAGLKSTVTGIQSASEETRKKVYLRTESTEDIIKADRILSKYGICKTYDFVIDHPWESQTELHDIFEFALNMKKPFELNMHSLVLLPGTELAKRAIRDNFSTEEKIINKIVSDPYTSSRRVQWIKGIPETENKLRNYWLFMIYSALYKRMPRKILKKIAYNPTINRYPQIFDYKKHLSNLPVNENVSLSITSRYNKLEKLKKFLDRYMRIKKKLKFLLSAAKDILAILNWLIYVSYCIFVKLPIEIYRKKINIHEKKVVNPA